MRWHPHELRHSCASILLAQGVPIEVVSRVLAIRQSVSPPMCTDTSSIRSANRPPKRWQKRSGRSRDRHCVTANRCALKRSTGCCFKSKPNPAATNSAMRLSWFSLTSYVIGLGRS